jgi:hypothetical protein
MATRLLLQETTVLFNTTAHDNGMAMRALTARTSDRQSSSMVKFRVQRP